MLFSINSDEKSQEGSLTETITTLEEAHKMIKSLQCKVRTQSHQFLVWHQKFKVQEDVIAHIIQERNDKLRSLSTKLIMFEAKLYRKQKEIGTLLAQHDIVINKQQQTIKFLQTQLNEAGLKSIEDKFIPDNITDSDSAVIMDDDESFTYYRPNNPNSITVARSISDVIQQSNSCKILTLRRSNGYLRRPEILETVYSVEEDGDTDGISSPSKEDNNHKPPRIYTKERFHKQHDNIELFSEDRKQEPTTQVTVFNRVMSNHRSVTKPKDVKYKRINKAKSKSLEELRGRLRSWVEKSNRFTFSLDQS